MKIQKAFAPITITLDTPEDLKKFLNMLERVENGCRNSFYYGPQVKEEVQLSRYLIDKLRT